MAVFNKRQVGYIKAIAGVGKHKTYIHATYRDTLANGYDCTSTNSRNDHTYKKLRVYTIGLTSPNVAVDASDVSALPTAWSPNSEKLGAGCRNGGYMGVMNLMTAACVAEKDEDNFVDTNKRVGPEFFLDSTHLRMRFTMPDFTVTSGKQPHYEYRLIIFRNRKPVASRTPAEGATPVTAEDQGSFVHGVSLLNFHYDLFNGYVGRPVGLQGFRKRQALDNSELCSGNVRSGTSFTTTGGTTRRPTGEQNLLTADDYMTLPVNDADYIVKCDERFFLGPEHGKSHYEKNIRFDWNQRGETDSDNMQNGLPEGFNGCWYVMLLGTSNDQQDPNLNILYRGTTYVESA